MKPSLGSHNCIRLPSSLTLAVVSKPSGSRSKQSIFVIECDFRQTPLEANSVDVIVFVLSPMGPALLSLSLKRSAS
jgi:hypothetical protein